jgi:hypothetical protein
MLVVPGWMETTMDPAWVTVVGVPGRDVVTVEVMVDAGIITVDPGAVIVWPGAVIVCPGAVTV